MEKYVCGTNIKKWVFHFHLIDTLRKRKVRDVVVELCLHVVDRIFFLQ